MTMSRMEVRHFVDAHAQTHGSRGLSGALVAEACLIPMKQQKLK